MISMDLLSVVRRWHHRDGLPIREIEHRTGLSWNTIRKYLHAGTVEPVFRASERPSKLDLLADKLKTWLVHETIRPRKQRRTGKRLYSDLLALGYTGSYGRVAAFIRTWRVEQRLAQQTTGRGVFIPLRFQPSEAFRFDWGED